MKLSIQCVVTVSLVLTALILPGLWAHANAESGQPDAAMKAWTAKMAEYDSAKKEWRNEMENYQGGQCQARPSGWHCPFRRPYWKCILAYIGIIHLLLTAIVFRDLRKSAPFMSGLWVPVVLMGGLPATVAYAVFRLALVKSEPR